MKIIDYFKSIYPHDTPCDISGKDHVWGKWKDAPGVIYSKQIRRCRRCGLTEYIYVEPRRAVDKPETDFVSDEQFRASLDKFKKEFNDALRRK